MEIASLVGAPARRGALSDFLAEPELDSWNHYHARQIAARAGIAPGDVGVVVQELRQAWVQLVETIAVSGTDRVKHFHAWVQTTARNNVYLMVNRSEEGPDAAGVTGQQNRIRRRRSFEKFLSSRSDLLGSDVSREEQIAAYNEHIAATRKDPAKSGAFVSEDDLETLRAPIEAAELVPAYGPFGDPFGDVMANAMYAQFTAELTRIGRPDLARILSVWILPSGEARTPREIARVTSMTVAMVQVAITEIKHVILEFLDASGWLDTA